MLLADQDAGETHLGKLAPKVPTEARWIVPVAQIAHVTDRSMVRHETFRGVAKHGLFVIQVEGHGILLVV